MKKQIHFLKITGFILFVVTSATSCSSEDTLNDFTIQNEINLGKILRDDISEDTTLYPILRESAYPLVYSRLNAIKDSILLSELLTFDSRFDWQLRIIQNDNIIQAFSLPGGYLYIYTGMLKALESEDQLAGLLAYEMAQTELRVITTKLIEKYSQTLLIQLANDSEQAIQTEVLNSISADLTELGISDAEINQTELLATNYLAQIDNISCEGLASLFEVLIQNNTSEIAWTKANPDLNTRKTRIENYTQSLNCNTSASSNDYSEIKNALP